MGKPLCVAVYHIATKRADVAPEELHDLLTLPSQMIMVCLLSAGFVPLKVHAINEGSFTDLMSVINAAHNGDTVTLDIDYKYEGTGDGIIIDNKTITIDLNRHTIDANQGEIGEDFRCQITG